MRQKPGSSTHFQAVLLLMVVLLLGAGGWFTYSAVHISNVNSVSLVNSITSSGTKPTNFQQCAAAGNPIQQSYPEVCTTKSGQHFVQGK